MAISYYNLTGQISAVQKIKNVEYLTTSIQNSSIEIDMKPEDIYSFLREKLINQNWKLIEGVESNSTLLFKARSESFRIFSNQVQITISPLSNNHSKILLKSEPSFRLLEYTSFD